MTQPRKLFAKIGGKTVGPLGITDLKGLAAAGRVMPDTEVTDGDGRWIKAGAYPGIFDLESPPAVSPRPTESTPVKSDERLPEPTAPASPSVADIPRHGLLEAAATLCAAFGVVGLLLGLVVAAAGLAAGNQLSLATGTGSTVSGAMLCLLSGLARLGLQVASDVRIARDVMLRIEMRGRNRVS